MVRDNRHDSAYIFGAICPNRDVGAAMVTPAANTEMMNLHLAEISTQVAPGSMAALICDGAGWHQTGGRLCCQTTSFCCPCHPTVPSGTRWRTSGIISGRTSSAQQCGTATTKLSRPVKPPGTGSSPLPTASAPSEHAAGQRLVSRAVGINRPTPKLRREMPLRRAKTGFRRPSHPQPQAKNP